MLGAFNPFEDDNNRNNLHWEMLRNYKQKGGRFKKVTPQEKEIFLKEKLRKDYLLFRKYTTNSIEELDLDPDLKQSNLKRKIRGRKRRRKN